MSLKLLTRWEIEFEGRTCQVPKHLVEHWRGKHFLKFFATHQGLVKMFSEDGKIPKNASMASSPGLLAIKRARNVASGLIPDKPLVSECLGLVEGDRQCDKPKKPRRNSASARLLETTVFLDLPGHPGLEVKRAKSIEESVAVPMDEQSLAKVFKAIAAIGVSIVGDKDVKRTYIKDGAHVGARRSKKSRTDQSDQDESDDKDTRGDDDDCEHKGSDSGNNNGEGDTHEDADECSHELNE